MSRARLILAVLALTTASAQDVRFVNRAAEAGLTHVFPNGGDESKTWILETTGSGAAWIDYDNDGLQDAFLVSGEGGTNRLYRNRGDGKFTDVTASVGLESSGWGQGVCVGDYDRDGFFDLFVTYWGQNRLYRNESGERFREVTEAAGLRQDRVRYNTGCAFFDADNDGDLDLFVANYLEVRFRDDAQARRQPLLLLPQHSRPLADRAACRSTATCSTATRATGRSATSLRPPASPRPTATMRSASSPATGTGTAGPTSTSPATARRRFST